MNVTTPENEPSAEVLAAQNAHLHAILGRARNWLERTAAAADDDGLIGQDALPFLDRILDGIGTADRAVTVVEEVEHDVLLTRSDGVEISTSGGAGQNAHLANLRMSSNRDAGRPVRRIQRTKTTIRTGWADA